MANNRGRLYKLFVKPTVEPESDEESERDDDKRAEFSIEDIDRIAKLQEWALKFVSDTIFYGIPVRANKRLKGDLCIYWVEPLPNLIEDTLAGKGVLDKVGH